MHNDHHDLPHPSFQRTSDGHDIPHPRFQSDLGRNDSGYAGSERMGRDDAQENVESHSTEMSGKYEDGAIDFEENISQRKLVKSQMYFNFSPSPLNTFEYGMTKLSRIEKILLDGFPIKPSQPLVKEYMSFTFVHGNHIDLYQASLALFDAEPDERQTDDNKSGIVVVYLDEKFTFEILTHLANKRDILDIKGNNTFIAVKSDELLQDRSKLRHILRHVFGEGLHVVDAKGKMDKLFMKFENVLSQAITNTRKMIDDVRKENGEDERLKPVEKRFSELCKIHDKGMYDSCETREKFMWSESALSRLKDQGLQGYTTEHNTLVLFFQCSSTSKNITENMIPIAIRKRFPKLKIILIQKPLFNPHHEVKSGDKLHPCKHASTNYGTIGMFGVLTQPDRKPRRCCISSPHVISSGQSAYILNATVKLGKCIWPPVVGANRINVEDLAVICSEFFNINILERKVGRQITLFHGDRSKLKRRKVFKFGATTLETIGFIGDPEFVLTIGDPVNVFLIEPEDPDDDRSRFSEPGDSGAIVLTKFGKDVVALSMIFGGDVDLEGVARNNSIAVDLKQALHRFEANNKGQRIKLDTL
nr:uncharacterized protein LOC111102587 isoform X2 [Crassostrea virginica]XP_022291107.1 uncharacterized protein LOC111102587 isoform X2 [Crassostrea virginica]XP_022291108.1 uncharacterized protein LOC111102587 isoform X2 [Crassostrea virginica]